jgi:hypothetical protein
VRLDRASGHMELGSNFRIITALQQQFGNLLLPWAQANRLFLHFRSSSRDEINNRRSPGISFFTNPLLKAPFAVQPQGSPKFWLGLPEFIAFTLPSSPISSAIFSWRLKIGCITVNFATPRGREEPPLAKPSLGSHSVMSRRSLSDR